jgi:hypothetical protein
MKYYIDIFENKINLIVQFEELKSSGIIEQYKLLNPVIFYSKSEDVDTTIISMMSYTKIVKSKIFTNRETIQMIMERGI